MQTAPVFWPTSAVKVPIGDTNPLPVPPENEIVGIAVYNDPPLVTVMLAMPPLAFRIAEAAALTPEVSPLPRLKLTVGAVVYPEPKPEEGMVTLTTESAADCARDLPPGQAMQAALLLPPAAE